MHDGAALAINMSGLNPIKNVLRPTVEVRRGPTIFAMGAITILGGLFWLGVFVFFIVAYIMVYRPVGLFPSSVWQPALASTLCVAFSTWQEGFIVPRARLVGADIAGLTFAGLGLASSLFTLVTIFLEPWNCTFDILASNVERVALCENSYILYWMFGFNCAVVLVCFLNGAVSLGSMISLTGRSLNPFTK